MGVVEDTAGCPRCDALVSADTLSCPTCGAPLAGDAPPAFQNPSANAQAPFPEEGVPSLIAPSSPEAAGGPARSTLPWSIAVTFLNVLLLIVLIALNWSSPPASPAHADQVATATVPAITSTATTVALPSGTAMPTSVPTPSSAGDPVPPTPTAIAVPPTAVAVPPTATPTSPPIAPFITPTPPPRP